MNENIVLDVYNLIISSLADKEVNRRKYKGT